MTAPDVPLSVAGNVRALNFIGPEDIQFGIYTNKDYSSGAAIQFYGINGDIPNSMYFMTGSTLTERVRIDSDGNVGIGTTDPGAYKLNVAGNTKISGNLDVTGTISGGDSGGFVPSTYAGGESVTFPNGLIMKNGKTNSIAIGGSEAITFSSPFPNATLNIVVTRIEATTAASYSWSVGGENRGGFTLYNNGARAGEYYWFAIGY
ncbi:MAG: hypothetical protein KKF50_01935, partial [Nanoarchaeota archaeon]|nr:hypothetical protein [Nanoarchaeota archaeon]